MRSTAVEGRLRAKFAFASNNLKHAPHQIHCNKNATEPGEASSSLEAFTRRRSRTRLLIASESEHSQPHTDAPHPAMILNCCLARGSRVSRSALASHRAAFDSRPDCSDNLKTCACDKPSYIFFNEIGSTIHGTLSAIMTDSKHANTDVFSKLD